MEAARFSQALGESDGVTKKLVTPMAWPVTTYFKRLTGIPAGAHSVAIQDVRGRGTSEGEFDLLATERDDGCDAVQWASGLPGSTGAVGMYGFS